MPRSLEQLRRDAKAIWHAGVDAVRADRLVLANLRVEGRQLHCGGESIDLDDVRRIAVVGAGKAGAAMSAAVEKALGPAIAAEKQLQGWVNVPADTLLPLAHIHLHAARPAGVNEPTPVGLAGSLQILRLVEALQPDDLCLALISGGGSALLPAPVEGIALDDKLAVTRHLSAAGATIGEINSVRKRLSRIKGGGLARACRAGRLCALIISDVPGDALDVIASGPTVPDDSAPDAAQVVLLRYNSSAADISPAVFAALREERPKVSPDVRCRVTNLLIGNNAMAVDAAGLAAERLGYSHAMVSANAAEGTAEEVGAHLAAMARRMRDRQGPDCLVSGGEPVVRLVESAVRGRGGRNQQLALSAAVALADDATGIVILSAGTDGEDGPTDAAGASVDEEILTRASDCGIDLADYLRRNDAYSCLDRLGALVRTGPTGTNVCDLRVVVVDRVELQGHP